MFFWPRQADFKERSYDQAPSDAVKTEEDVRIIKNSLERDSLFTTLDEEQIRAFIQAARPVTYKAGDVIIQQGKRGMCFYVLAEGQVDVFDEVRGGRPRRLTTKVKGDHFGDGSFFFDRTRSASLVAKTDVKCWFVDKRVFLDTILASPKQRRAFDQVATRVDENGERYMTVQDFVSAYVPIANPELEAQLLALYRAFRGAKDRIYFSDFALFNVLMARPDPEYDIAFALLDRQKRGYLILDDIREYVKTRQEADPTLVFDMDCDLIKGFFGQQGTARMRIDTFSAFFTRLQEEFGQQTFRALIETESGHRKRVDPQTFADLLEKYAGWDVPPGLIEAIRERDASIAGEPVRTFTFADFLAYQLVVSHLPALCRAITNACKTKRGPITKEDFKVVARAYLGPNISRVENEAVFEVFDGDRDGKISIADVHRIMGESFGELKVYRGREDTRTFAPPVGTPDVWEESRRLSLNPLLEAFEHFALGAIAGGVGATAVYPIDLVKTRLQNQRSKGVVMLPDGSKLPHYRGALDCFLQTLKREGFFGLYRGLLPQLVGVAPEKAIKLTVNDLLRSAFSNRDKVTGQDSIYFPLEVLAGCGAGASQVIFTNPLEIVKIRLQVQGETNTMLLLSGKTPPPPKSAFAIVRDLGFLGLYKGAGACFLRDIPFSGIYFPAYAAAKKWLAGDASEVEPHHLLIAGALAGIPAASLVTPADVIKTRLQVVARQGETTYAGITDCAVKIIETEGVGALFKGAGMRVLRSSPQFGVTLLAYEMLHRLVAPHSTPQPPTNVPIDKADFSDAFRSPHVVSAASIFSRMFTGPST